MTPVAVAGRMERSIASFIRACEIHLVAQQESIMPDNALIAVLCDAIRLAREQQPPSLLVATEERVREVVGRILWSKVTEIGGGRCYLETHLDDVADELAAALVNLYKGGPA